MCAALPNTRAERILGDEVFRSVKPTELSPLLQEADELMAIFSSIVKRSRDAA
jgi:hypothetical protein